MTPGDPARVELLVEELVLHGFRREDRYAIAESLGRELERQFEGHGVPGTLLRSADIERLDAGRVVVRGGGANGMGVDLGRAVYRGLSA